VRGNVGAESPDGVERNQLTDDLAATRVRLTVRDLDARAINTRGATNEPPTGDLATSELHGNCCLSAREGLGMCGWRGLRVKSSRDAADAAGEKTVEKTHESPLKSERVALKMRDSRTGCNEKRPVSEIGSDTGRFEEKS